MFKKLCCNHVYEKEVLVDNCTCFIYLITCKKCGKAITYKHKVNNHVYEYVKTRTVSYDNSNNINSFIDIYRCKRCGTPKEFTTG